MTLTNTYIGFDWDGTLELFDLKPSKALIHLLQNLKAQGVQFFLASGKTCATLSEVSAGIIEPFLIAGESGGHIQIPSQGIERFADGDQDLAHFAAVIQDHDLPPHTNPLAKATIWCRIFGPHARAASQIIETVIAEHQLALDVFPHPEIDGAVDVVPRGISKANVLAFIPQNAKIYYFGDAPNDLELLNHKRVCPNTMANAHDEVKAVVASRGGLIATQPACLGVEELLQQLFDNKVI